MATGERKKIGIMSVFPLLIVVIMLLLVVVGIVVVVKFCAKPFSLQQKLGLTISLVALFSVLFLPIVSLGGAIQFSLKSIVSLWIDDLPLFQRYCESHVLSGLTAAIFLPIMTSMMFMFNRCKRWCGCLLFIVPLYEILLPLCSSFFRGFELGTGIYIYILCGIALLAMPWFIKEQQENPSKGSTAVFVASLLFIGFLAFVPALAIENMVCQ